MSHDDVITIHTVPFQELFLFELLGSANRLSLQIIGSPVGTLLTLLVELVEILFEASTVRMTS